MKDQPSNSVLTKARTIYVSNISVDATETSMREFFELCGTIEHIDISIVQEDGNSYQMATILFDDEKSVKTAALLTDTFFLDRVISVCTNKTDTEEPIQKGRMDVVTDIVAIGCIWGSKLWKKALDFDSQHKITAKVLEKTKQVDQAFKISENVKTVSKKVVEINDKVDDLFQITENKNKLVSKINECYTSYKHRTESHEKFFQDLEVIVGTSLHDAVKIVQDQIDIVKHKIESGEDKTEDVVMTEMMDVTQQSSVVNETAPLLSDVPNSY